VEEEGDKIMILLSRNEKFLLYPAITLSLPQYHLGGALIIVVVLDNHPPSKNLNTPEIDSFKADSSIQLKGRTLDCLYLNA